MACAGAHMNLFMMRSCWSSACTYTHGLMIMPYCSARMEDGASHAQDAGSMKALQKLCGLARRFVCMCLGGVQRACETSCTGDVVCLASPSVPSLEAEQVAVHVVVLVHMSYPISCLAQPACQALRHAYCMHKVVPKVLYVVAQREG